MIEVCESFKGIIMTSWGAPVYDIEFDIIMHKDY